MATDTLPTFRKEATEPIPQRYVTNNLDNAIKAVYRRYGTDLQAFFRDAYEKELARQNEKKTADAEDDPQ